MTKEQIARSAATEWCRCFKCDGVINDTNTKCEKPNVTCLKWRDGYRTAKIAVSDVLGYLKRIIQNRYDENQDWCFIDESHEDQVILQEIERIDNLLCR